MGAAEKMVGVKDKFLKFKGGIKKSSNCISIGGSKFSGIRYLNIFSSTPTPAVINDHSGPNYRKQLLHVLKDMYQAANLRIHF